MNSSTNIVFLNSEESKFFQIDLLNSTNNQTNTTLCIRKTIIKNNIPKYEIIINNCIDNNSGPIKINLENKIIFEQALQILNKPFF